MYDVFYFFEYSRTRGNLKTKRELANYKIITHHSKL